MGCAGKSVPTNRLEKLGSSPLKEGDTGIRDGIRVPLMKGGTLELYWPSTQTRKYGYETTGRPAGVAVIPVDARRRA